MGSDDAVGTIKAVPVLSVRLAGEDIRKADAALTKALEAKVRTGVVAWQNPQSGARGSFTVAAGSAGPCRPFAATVEVDATSEMVVGSACRNASGSWAIDAITARTPG